VIFEHAQELLDHLVVVCNTTLPTLVGSS